MLFHYTKKLIFSLLLCGTTAVYAEVVPVDNAKQMAADFFRASFIDRLSSTDALDLVYTGGSATKPCYYVFNACDGQGYIIISADDSTTPVLGYSLDGNYKVSSMPPALNWMMSGLENEIKASPSLQKPLSLADRSKMVRRAAQSNERILLQTPQWRQEAPFNRHVPGNALTGCVGTAMAMIMKYHQYPEHGTGSYNGVNFDVAYDWSNMRMDSYRSGYSEVEAEAVSTLIYHAAVSIGTQFGYSGSSAYEVKVPAALINYFGYDPGVSYRKRSETPTQAEFDRLVENEIRARRPVLYCGQDVTAGHAFVVDGYDPLSGMIHVNWGWGGADGNNNGGWYVTTALNPTVSQSHSFNNLTTIIYNIKPGDGLNDAWSPLHITADGHQPGMSSDLLGDLTPGKQFSVRVGNIKNLSYDKFSGKFAVALFDASGAFKCTLSKIDNMTLNGMALYPAATVMYACSLPEGAEVAEGDMIRMATSLDNGTTWQPMAGELTTVNEIPAKGAEPQYFSINTPSGISGAVFTGDDKVIKGWDYSFRVVPENPEKDVVTVKGNGYLLTAGPDHTYTIGNVLDDMEIVVYVQPASEVREKRSLWVNTPGTLETLIEGAEAGTIKDLTLFGTIDARDFAFMKGSMKLTRLDLSGVRIAANGTNQANAIPRDAFRNLWSLKEVILPPSVNRLNNGCFRLCGITSIVIPAAVNTYEYNVFNGSSALKDIWVQNPSPAFVNWCVFYGTPSDRTVHCVNKGSADTYKQNKYWNQPGVDDSVIFTCPQEDNKDFPVVADCALAVMENKDVKFTCDTNPGRYAPGTKVSFKAEHIADDDNRMDVYANSTLLKPDAEGNYTVTLTTGTIIHFDIVEPIAVSSLASPWVLTDATGSVGLLTDMVNVMPGVPFTIRANAFDAPSKAFWAAALTTADGRIKEFISEISNWSAEPGKNFRMTISCCVKEASVREGNLIRLVTSIDKKNWKLVNGANDNVIAALPALNNATPVYNFTFPEGLEEKANLSGIVTSAVRGRDLAFKIIPKSAGNVLTMFVNGVPFAKEVKSITYSFIAKEDLDFDVRVISPDEMEAVVFDLQPGEHLWDPNNTELKNQRREALRPKVVVRGNIDYTDLALFREANAWNKVVSLDLSGATIIADRSNPTGYPADEMPANSFCPSNTVGTPSIKLKELKFPATVRRIGASALKGCSNIVELELPVNLYNDETVSISGKDRAHQGGLRPGCFTGCDNLTTLFCYASPVNGKVHHLDFSAPTYSTVNMPKVYNDKLGLSDPSKVAVVVKPEYYQEYTTAHGDETDIFYDDWFNGWKLNGFNIVYDYPVYGVNFDVTRCFAKDPKFDVSRAVSFLGDNSSKNTLDFCGQLYVAVKSNASRPEGVDAYDAVRQVKVYDNGKLLPDNKIAEDGSVSLTFYNPNDLSHKELVGNHHVDVVYLYDVKFACASGNLRIYPDIHNNESLGDAATEFEYLNYYDAEAPVLQGVRENSRVRFKVETVDLDATQVRPVVKIGENVVASDDEGYYIVEVTDEDVNVNVYTVPVNGASLTWNEISVINPEEAVDVTSIALSGEIAADVVKDLVGKFPALEELDLSALSEALPEGAMAGNETLVTVILPEAPAIEANTFDGCRNLTTVVVPECVDIIGADAFNGCSSLKNLSFSGIKSVGANAFKDCNRMTSVIFSSPRPDATPARVSRIVRTTYADGYDAKAFDGLNPNCIVYIDEDVSVPDNGGVNYVQVRHDADSESGRVYEALSDIVIDPEYDFHVMNAFDIKVGNTVSMEMTLGATNTGDKGWKGLLLPFSPSKVTDKAGNAIEHYVFGGSDSMFGRYMTASFDADGSLILTSEILENTPYLAAMYQEEEMSVVRFVAEGCKIPQTPEEIRIDGPEYSLIATFSEQELSPAGIYTLREDGSAFDAALDALEIDENEAMEKAISDVAIRPFSVYAVSGAEVSGFPIKVDVVNDIPTGVYDVADTSSFKIVIEGGVLAIYSDCDDTIDVFNINGQHVTTLRLAEGRNVIEDLVSGIYIIRGQKVIL